MKTHRTDGLSLTFGLIFVGIVAWWLLVQVVNVSVPNLGWVVAGTLIVLGLLGLVGALRGGRETEAPPPAATPPATEPTGADPTAADPTDVTLADDRPDRE